MPLFSKADMEQINQIAEKTREAMEPPKSAAPKSMNAQLIQISEAVQEYFKDSPAILITSRSQLHDYVTDLLDSEYAGIDTETTGLDRVHDHVVGSSLYFPGGVECYIPNKHLVPIFDEPYRGQLDYREVKEELDRIRRSKTKLIFANADFDLAMFWNSMGIDLSERAYYDVILAWRCIKDNEPDNALKVLYNKYVLKGQGDPKKFSDFFSPKLFPYCKPEIAKLYAANDAKITYELFQWQLPYVTPGNPKCDKRNLQAVSRLIWDVEMPLMRSCFDMHRTGVFLDKSIARPIQERYNQKHDEELKVLGQMVQQLIEENDYPNNMKRPFRTGADFNPNSPPQVKYLLLNLLRLNIPDTSGTGKDVLTDLNLPVTNQILKVRSLKTLISTFVEKMPKSTTPDSRIHASFKQIGADTGRFSSEAPNMQNIPSHAVDIRHMFRATPSFRKNIDTEEEENGKVSLNISRYDRVYKKGHIEIPAQLLVVGDLIEVLEDKVPSILQVSELRFSDSTPDVEIILQPVTNENGE